MSQVDSYIKRCRDVLDGSSDEDAGVLVKEIVSIFVGRDDKIKHGLDRYRGRISAVGGEPRFDNIGDLRKLMGKLELLREDEQASLLCSDSPTAYLDMLICRCNDAINSPTSLKELESLVMEVCYGAYCQQNPWFAAGLSFFDHKGVYDEETARTDIALIRGKLLSIKADTLTGIAKSSQGPTAVAMSSSVANVSISIEQVLRDIDSVDESEASEEEKEEIKALLEEVEDSKVPSKREKAVKAVLGWLSKHSMDLITLALPYIMKAQGLS